MECIDKEQRGHRVVGESSTPFADRLMANTRALAELDATVFPCPKRTRIVTIANQKGGVGKTTTAVNLAVALAIGGLSVVVVDIDPQGNASTALGIDHRAGTASTYDVLTGESSLAECLQPCPEHEGVRVCPATIDLSGAELELSAEPMREYILQRALSEYLATHRDVDVVIIDCPPSLGLLTLNAFVAAHEVLVPIQAEYYALEGVSLLLTTIDRIREVLNPELAIIGLLMTMVDSRTNLATEVCSDVREHFPELTFSVTVPRSVKLSEAPSFGGSIFSHDPRGSGAVAYRTAALELARRLAERSATRTE